MRPGAKGRIQAGADADIVVFDPATVTDRATYEHPNEHSVGMRYVLVNGVPVIDKGAACPGGVAGDCHSMMRRLFVRCWHCRCFVVAAPRYQWDVQVPLRDGVKLHASLYSPLARRDPRRVSSRSRPIRPSPITTAARTTRAMGSPIWLLIPGAAATLKGSSSRSYRKRGMGMTLSSGLHGSRIATARLRCRVALIRAMTSGRRPRSFLLT